MTELGGSDAFIVLEDAHIDHAVKWAVWGRMYNAGQTCCAAKRFIVVEAVADAFLTKFRAALAAFEPGDPMDEQTTLGPLSSESAVVALLAQVDAAVAFGAKVVLGGKRIDRPGSLVRQQETRALRPHRSVADGRGPREDVGRQRTLVKHAQPELAAASRR